MRSELLEAHSRPSSQVCAQLSSERQSFLERESKLNEDLKEAERKFSVLQTDKVKLLEELDAAKSALAKIEIVKVETGSVYLAGLRAQLDEAKRECDHLKASQLAIQGELEESKGELEIKTQELVRLWEQVSAPIGDREPGYGKKISEEQEKDSAQLRKKLQDSARRIAVLVSQLEEMKKKSELHIQESARLESQAQVKATEDEQCARRTIASLEKDVEDWKKKSKDQVQELTRLRKQVQSQANNSRSATNRIASLEQELEECKQRSEEQVQETTRLRKQVEDILNQRQTASPPSMASLAPNIPPPLPPRPPPSRSGSLACDPAQSDQPSSTKPKRSKTDPGLPTNHHHLLPGGSSPSTQSTEPLWFCYEVFHLHCRLSVLSLMVIRYDLTSVMPR